MAKVTKAKLGDITFQLNPTTITHDGGSVWSEVNSPGMSQPIQVYSYGKAETYNFEMYIYTRHKESVDAEYIVNKLNEYRKSKQSVIFRYGRFVGRVIVRECPFNVEAINKNMTLQELRIPITLVRVGDI